MQVPTSVLPRLRYAIRLIVYTYMQVNHEAAVRFRGSERRRQLRPARCTFADSAGSDKVAPAAAVSCDLIRPWRGSNRGIKIRKLALMLCLPTRHCGRAGEGRNVLVDPLCVYSGRALAVQVISMGEH
jgi:hypothetical protein